MKAKEEDVYFNVWDYKDDNYPFQVFVGCRGGGKTFSSLSGGYEHAKAGEGRFIYMRRTQEQLDAITDGKDGEGLNPFKKINQSKGWNVGFRQFKKKVTVINDRYVEKDVLKYMPRIYGYGIALTSVASISGLDASDCVDWFYDEYIKQKHEKRMAGEFEAIMGAYETFNRNREFDGTPALRFWALSNAHDIYNELFKGLKVVHDAEIMCMKGIEHKYYPERRLAIHILKPKPEFVAKKSQTALAKLTAGTEYGDMAFKNDFAYNDFSLVMYKSIKGYTPVAAIDNAYIYRKKGERAFHCCYASTKCERYSSKLVQDVMGFRRRWSGMLVDAYADGRLTFESYEIKAIVLSVIL